LYDAKTRARSCDKGGAELIDRRITVHGRRGDAKTFGSVQSRIHLYGTQVAKLPDAAHPPASRPRGGTR
jgi:coenzyme PQQ precursor peptide PqqA